MTNSKTQRTITEQSTPIVTVVILCHNQAQYIKEAILSVENQTYPSIEMIFVDDASTDGSSVIFEEYRKNHSNIPFIQNHSVQGNCRSFNKALKIARGKYIIDLAADDYLMPDRISIGVEDMEQLPTEYGVHYGNVQHISADGNILKTDISTDLPSGDVYSDLIQRYFVSTVSMMMKRKVLDELGGYDESLSYEDFDFWIRSARNYKYYFNPAILVRKRSLPNSLSTQQFKWRNSHQRSTLEVCKKIKSLNKNKAENQALKNRIRYEIRQTLRYGNFALTRAYFSLYARL